MQPRKYLQNKIFQMKSMVQNSCHTQSLFDNSKFQLNWKYTKIFNFLWDLLYVLANIEINWDLDTEKAIKTRNKFLLFLL